MRRFSKLVALAALYYGAVSCAEEPRNVERHAVSEHGVQPSTLDTARRVPAGEANTLVNQLPKPATSSPKNAASDSCPTGMVLVEGAYCPDVQLNCKRYLDPPGRYHQFRCAEYGPSRCLAARRHVRYCIDRDEYVPERESLPANHQSWSDANAVCTSLGKRVCAESEWNFACEGEEMRPYPYGFRRDPSACNADRNPVLNAAGKLRDLRSPADAYPRCVSPFGVRNLTGNLEEFVTIDGSRPARPAMKGAYWQPGRNHCRAAQTAHDRFYSGTETGFRCCAEAR